MKKLFLLISSVLFVFIPLAFAGQPNGHAAPGSLGAPEMGGPQDMMMDKGFIRSLEEIGLTEEQEQKLRDIHSSNKRALLNLRHDIQLSVMDMQDEYKKEKSDESKINSYIDKISEAQKKMMKIRSSQMLKMKAVLTPDQFKKLTKKMDKAKTKVKKGFFKKLMNKN